MKWGLGEEDIRHVVESGLEDMEKAPEPLWTAKAEIDAMSEQVGADMKRFIWTSWHHIAQATLANVWEEGDKPCVDLTHYNDDLSFRMVPEPKWRKRFDCLKCRAELKREAGC